MKLKIENTGDFFARGKAAAIVADKGQQKKES